MSDKAIYSIKFFTIPHDQQRYPTAGDWEDYMGNITIRVSDVGNPRYEQLVALHELVECLLCRWSGVQPQYVDEFDRSFIANKEGEPGDSPYAPYRQQHLIASVVERLAADLLGVDWNEYTRALEAL